MIVFGVLVTIAILAIGYALVTRDFSNALVANHSSQRPSAVSLYHYGVVGRTKWLAAVLVLDSFAVWACRRFKKMGQQSRPDALCGFGLDAHSNVLCVFARIRHLAV